MKKVYMIITFMLVSISTSLCFASPYSLGIIDYKQSNGIYIAIEHIIDEYGNIYSTCYGPVVLNSDGFWYYGMYDDNRNLSATPYLVGDEKKNESEMNELRYQNAVRQTNFMKKVHEINKSATRTQGVGKIATVPDSLIVLLVSFTDTPGTYNYRSSYENLLFSNGSYSSSPSPNSYTTYGSMRDYYYDMSRGQFSLIGRIANSDTTGGTINWIDIPYSKSYCDGMAANAFMDSVLAIAKIQQGIDYEDELAAGTHKMAIIYAGHIFFYGGGLHPQANTTDGIYICGEMMNSPHEVFTAIGWNCHEFAHLLGIYEDDYKGSYRYWRWGLMDTGQWCGIAKYNNIVFGGECPVPLTPDERNRLLWQSYTEVTTPQTFQLTFNTTYGLSNVYKMTATHAQGGSTQNFLLENRQ
ncbi:MAG: hypothetical protein Q8O92_00360 [Candidatus Latescibacter sp.]|nr:hypothetical protein [Candidatus Latescibacter sp.]